MLLSVLVNRWTIHHYDDSGMMISTVLQEYEKFLQFFLPVNYS